MSKIQAIVLERLLNDHITRVDNILKDKNDYSQKEIKIISTGCKLMKELARQINKKMEIE